MEIVDQFCTYAQILEDSTGDLVGYTLHIITEVSDCGYIATGSEVHTTQNTRGAYEIDIHIIKDHSILHFPYTTPLVHIVNLESLDLHGDPEKPMEVIVVVDGEKKDPKPLDQPSPNVIRCPIKM